ncbi:Bromodomain-containing protein [Dichotomocladium elegans]|nr:Bromodomain-containing protein [Dichotomocladium elegans]
MEGRPKRQSATDKDYRERKRLRKEKEAALGEVAVDEAHINSEEVQSQCRQLYKYIKDYRDPDDDEYLLSNFFIQLPSKRQYPDYYEVIKQPIALSSIKTKLDQQGYHSLTDMKADMELMVSNAKKYNMKDSQVYIDAVRIQKLVKHWHPRIEKEKTKKHKDKHSPSLPQTLSPSSDGNKSKTVLKLPIGAFGNIAARNNNNNSTQQQQQQEKQQQPQQQQSPQEHKVKAIRLKAVDKHAKKRASTINELMGAITASDVKKTVEILDSEFSFSVNELVEVEMFNDKFSWGPLHAACYFGDLRIAQALLHHQANVELKDTWYSATPLAWAAFGDNDKMVRFLVEKYNANRNAKNIHGQVPYDLVADKDDPRWAGLLKPPYTVNPGTSTVVRLPSESKTAVHPPTTKQVERPTPDVPEQPPKKRRGRPPKADKETMDALNMPVEKVDLSGFDTVAYMTDLFHAIRVHTDNGGRLYSEIFEDLPDREEYPDYYDVIKLPRSLAMIEDNMVHHRYALLQDWYDDMIRVFDNAMEYNEPGSRVYRDAKLLLRLLHRLKERFLIRDNIPLFQENEVMRLPLGNRPYEIEDRRRQKRAPSKPRSLPDDNISNAMPPIGPLPIVPSGSVNVAQTRTPGHTGNVVIPRGVMVPQQPFGVVNLSALGNMLPVGHLAHLASQTFGTPPEMILPEGTEGNPLLTANGLQPDGVAQLAENVNGQLAYTNPDFMSVFNVDIRKLRPLKAIVLETPDGSFSRSLGGTVVGHSLTVPSKVRILKIKPLIRDELLSEHKRISIVMLQNNGKLNVIESSIDPCEHPLPSWESAPLQRGINTIKVTVTANVTKTNTPNMVVPDYRTQVYFLFITQTW